MKTLATALAVSWLVSGSAALAQMGGAPHGGEGGPGGGRHLKIIGRILENPEVAEELGLTEEQQKTLRDKSYELRSREIELRADLEKAALEQARLMTRDDVDEQALMDAVEKTGAIRTEMAKLRVSQLLTIRKTLNEEQINSIRKYLHKHRRGNAKEARQERRDRRRQHPGRGHGREMEEPPPEHDE